MRNLAVSLVVVLLGACGSVPVTRSLGMLQADFADIVRTEAACSRNEIEEPVLCASDFAAMFGFVEAQADATLDVLGTPTEIGDRQIAVALHRLAAYASLEARSGNAAAHGDAGLALCDALGVAAPPRDCALLQLAGRYEQLNRFVADLTCVQGAGANCPHTKAELVDQYCPVVFRPLAASTETAKAQPLLAASVSGYLDTQVGLARDSMRALSQALIEDLVNAGGSVADIPVPACDCFGANPPSTCAGVPTETLEAVCIVASLDRDGTCPTL